MRVTAYGDFQALPAMLGTMAGSGDARQARAPQISSAGRAITCGRSGTRWDLILYISRQEEMNVEMTVIPPHDNEATYGQ